jgi:hypothetical protein
MTRTATTTLAVILIAFIGLGTPVEAKGGAAKSGRSSAAAASKKKRGKSLRTSSAKRTTARHSLATVASQVRTRMARGSAQQTQRDTGGDASRGRSIKARHRVSTQSAQSAASFRSSVASIRSTAAAGNRLRQVASQLGRARVLQKKAMHELKSDRTRAWLRTMRGAQERATGTGR